LQHRRKRVSGSHARREKTKAVTQQRTVGTMGEGKQKFVKQDDRGSKMLTKKILGAAGEGEAHLAAVGAHVRRL